MASNGLNPQQAAFKENYTDPSSSTFSNATASAIAAGYGKEYAENILSVGNEWLSEIIGDLKRLQKAEKVLDKTLEMVDDEDVARQRMAQDSAKFIASRLGKHKYSERQEHTGAEGKDLPDLSDALTKAIEKIYGKPSD